MIRVEKHFKFVYIVETLNDTEFFKNLSTTRDSKDFYENLRFQKLL